jgi:hypothetical protein
MAEREIRSAITSDSADLPVGEYGFVESYCDDLSCDCRRVLVNVVSRSRPGTILATIGYGWEPAEFYDSMNLGEGMKGPYLDTFNPQSPLAPALLDLFETLIEDPEYVARLERHYLAVKEAAAALADDNGSSMSLDEIIRSLETYTGVFPRRAVRAAVARREEITPRLLAILEQPAAELAARTYYEGHIFAMFLLAQFRERRAYPLVVRLLGEAGPHLDDLLGDVLTENVSNILASVSDTETAPIKELVENADLDEFLRTAALDSLVCLVANDLLDREDLLAYLRELFDERLEREPNYIWSSLVGASVDLGAVELADRIRDAFAADFVDEGVIDRKYVDRYIGENFPFSRERLNERGRYWLVDDVVSEMEWWASFEHPVPPSVHTQAEKSRVSQQRVRAKAKSRRKAQKASRKKNRH